MLRTTLMTRPVGEHVGMSFGLSSLIVFSVVFTIPLCFIGKERCAVPPEGGRQAITEMYLATTLPGILSTAISCTLLLCLYKLRSKDVAIMATCNAGGITRAQAESMLSRKY